MTGMKTKSDWVMNAILAIIVALALVLYASFAKAADTYAKQTGVKDTYQDAPAVAVVSDVSGIYVSGTVGMAFIGRDGSRDLDRTGSIVGEDGAETVFSHSWASGRDSDDLESLTLGGGISYLKRMPSSPLGMEIGLSADWYGNTESKRNAVGNTTMTIGDSDPFTSPFASTTTLKFAHDYDIDLVLTGHYFVADNLSVYAGGGISFAQASLKSSSSVEIGDRTAYANRINDDEFSLGGVIVAGIKWWANDRLSVGAEYNYKWHSFEFDGHSSEALNEGAFVERSHDSVNVDDDLHVVKLKASLKLN